MPTPLSRRTFLSGLGVSLALPWLDAMSPLVAATKDRSTKSPSPKVPGRIVFCYVPNGVNIKKWLPASAGNDYPLSPTLEALRDLRADFTVFRGLGHPNSHGGHSGADTWLTGADLQGTPGYDYRNSISVDQLVAEQLGQWTRVPSLELSSHGGTGTPGHSHTLAFSRDAIPLPAESSPRALFERLFVPDTKNSRRTRAQRFAEDKSILDAVRDQSQRLSRKLGAEDRRKLEEYLGSVRDVEQRIRQAESWMDVPKPRIDPKTLQLNAQPNDSGKRADYFRVMFDLIFLALQTDQTRVCTFQMGREAAGGSYAELGLNANHHELSHHGGDADMLDGLFKIDRFLLEQWAYFLKRLSQTAEQEQTLLGRTMVLYGSGMNSGEGGGHSPKNLPLLLAGGQGLGLKQGQHLTFKEDSTPLSNVFVSMLQRLGLEQERFQDSTGTLTGLQ